MREPLTLTLSPEYRGEGTRKEFARITAAHGVDFATRLLYDRVRRDRRHGEFIDRVESTRLADAPGDAPKDSTVVVVPGAFYRSYPHTEADGRRLIDAARRAGFRTDVVPLLDFGPVDDNAAILLDWLAARARRDGGPLVLASLSKGSLEVRRALALGGAGDAFRDVVAWVNVSGVPDGSLLADHMLGGPVRRTMTRLACLWMRADFGVMPQLKRGASGACGAIGEDEKNWAAQAPRLRIAHVIGFPLREHLTCRIARRNHRALARHGPNDGGGVLLADACRWPGALYPVWGADHFMRPPGGVEETVARVLTAAFSTCS